MSEIEREEFICRIKALSEDEMKLAVSLIPSEIIANEVGMRLLRNEQRISRAASVLK